MRPPGGAEDLMSRLMALVEWMVDCAIELLILAFIECNGSKLSDKPEISSSIEISAEES